MALGAYQAENTRGNVLNAIAHPNVVDPMAGITNAVTAARGIQDLRASQFNLQQAQLQPGYQAMRMLAATNQNPTNDDINAALGGAARLGGNVDGVVQNLSDWTARGGKPADFVRAYALGGMSPENQAQFGVGTPADVNTGPSLVSGVRGGVLSSTPGQFTPTSSIQLGLTPSESTQMVQVPQVDANGRPTGTYVLRPAGVVYGTGVPGGGGGAAGAGGGAGGGGGVVPAGPPPGSSVQPGQPLSQKDAALAQYAQRESGNQNIFSNVQVPGYTQQQLGSGYYQIIPSTWAEGQQLAGIPPNQRTQLAIQAPPQQQYQVASALYDRYGGQPWARSAPGGAGGGGGGGGGQPPGVFLGASSAQPVTGGVPAQPGGGANVQPVSSGPMPQYDQTGRPIVQGGGGGGGGYGGGGGAGGGGTGPGVIQRDPSGAPYLTPPSPYELPQFEQSSKDYVADQVNNKTLSRRIAPLQNAISIIKENPSLVTGPSSENWYQWVQGVAAGAGIDVGDVHNANAYNELAKQLAMNLQQSGADPSDMARLMHEASQPNTMQGRQAIVTLAAEQIGYQRLKSAQYLEFQSRHPTDSNTKAQFYNQETGDWASQQDPMAYAADLIPQAELQAHLRGLNPDQQRAFVESLTNAKRLFKFKLPTGGQNGS